MVVGDIQAELGIPASTLSHHLEKLKNEGLVNVRREKQFLWYSANTAALTDLLSFLYAECCSRNQAIEPACIVQIDGIGASPGKAMV
jgi:DNA-binding transcriptional ArsR family regulator